MNERLTNILSTSYNNIQTSIASLHTMLTDNNRKKLKKYTFT